VHVRQDFAIVAQALASLPVHGQGALSVHAIAVAIASSAQTKPTRQPMAEATKAPGTAKDALGVQAFGTKRSEFVAV
jgi:hypothetical protein